MVAVFVEAKSNSVSGTLHNNFIMHSSRQILSHDLFIWYQAKDNQKKVHCFCENDFQTESVKIFKNIF